MTGKVPLLSTAPKPLALNVSIELIITRSYQRDFISFIPSTTDCVGLSSSYCRILLRKANSLIGRSGTKYNVHQARFCRFWSRVADRFDQGSFNVVLCSLVGVVQSTMYTKHDAVDFGPEWQIDLTREVSMLFFVRCSWRTLVNTFLTRNASTRHFRPRT